MSANCTEDSREYLEGPSACMPSTKVLHSIKGQVRKSKGLSRGDV